MTDVTKILNEIKSGDRQASEKLLPILYDELRKLAHAKLKNERSDQTLQATALVHEAYLKLVGEYSDESEPQWNNLGHFFGAAAEAMRRILVDRARARNAVKRGGAYQRIELENIGHPAAQQPEQLLALDKALDALEAKDKPKAELVKLRFFAGLTGKQAAEALGVSESTADRHWAYSRAWLRTEMEK